jgi:hypothetical protein
MERDLKVCLALSRLAGGKTERHFHSALNASLYQDLKQDP